MMALIKTMTYGVMHVTVATILAYIISGNWRVAISIGLLEPFVQTFFFYFHERTWEAYRLRREARAKYVSDTAASSQA